MASRISELIIEWLTVGGNAFSSQTSVPLVINKVGVGSATIPTSGSTIAEYINLGQLWILGAAAASTSVKSSQIVVSSSDTGAGGAAAIEFWRGTSASWQIVNNSGDLYFRNNYTSAAQTTYSKDGIRLSYNGGAHDSTYGSRTIKPVLLAYGIILANKSIESAEYFMQNVPNNSITDNGYWIRANNVTYGRLFISAVGTANSGENNATLGAQGYGRLDLGNATTRPASGTAGGAGNARGVIRMYGSNDKYTDVLAQANGNQNFYLPNYAGAMYAIHAGNNNAIGNANKGVYVAANGRATVMTYKLEGDVVQGAAPRLAYYQGANSIQDTPLITYIDGNNSKSVAEAGLLIYCATRGNTASELISGTAGLFSYGDGGPKIRFNSGLNGSQAGELIFTDHDTAGTGASWHFVSNLSDWNVISKRFHARTSISIGTNLPVTSLALNVSGLVAITNNSNTVTIGSQNANWCHIYNSADIPFIFNKTVASTNGNLGTAEYPWRRIYIGPSGDRHITHVGANGTYDAITFFDGADQCGNGIRIGAGGSVIIGSGESSSTIRSLLSIGGGNETTYITSDGTIEFYPSLNSYNAAAHGTMTTYGFMMGVLGNTTSETDVGTRAGSGNIYLFAGAGTSSTRGIYGVNSSNTGAYILKINSSNQVSYVDYYNNADTKLAYSQSGLSHTAITWLTCWNGYELRAISKNYFPIHIGSLNGGTGYDGQYKATFNANKASIPRDKLISWYSSAYSNGSVGFGYQLTGHDSSPYGGFFIAHYDNAHYLGVSNGGYYEHRLIFGKKDGYYGSGVPSGTYYNGDVYFQYI